MSQQEQEKSAKMSKGTMVALAALIFSIAAYGIQDIRRSAANEQQLKQVCVELERLKGSNVSLPVLENRVEHLEDNTNRLINKMDRLLDEIRTLHTVPITFSEPPGAGGEKGEEY
jgi:hypothetical protein